MLVLSASEQSMSSAVGMKMDVRKQQKYCNPWAFPEEAQAAPVSTLALSTQDKESLRAQHQLAAVDLLLQESAFWQCQAGPLDTQCAVQGDEYDAGPASAAVKEEIITIEAEEVRRDPLAGRHLLATEPLKLTPDQQRALDCIVGDEYDLRPFCCTV